MIPLKHHSSLTLEKWQSFAKEQQILMIANEVQRIINGLENGQGEAITQEAIERGLELVDLTIACGGATLRRELLRWRDLFAMTYLQMPPVASLKELLRSLILLNGKSAGMLLVA